MLKDIPLNIPWTIHAFRTRRRSQARHLSVFAFQASREDLASPLHAFCAAAVHLTHPVLEVMVNCRFTDNDAGIPFMSIIALANTSISDENAQADELLGLLICRKYLSSLEDQWATIGWSGAGDGQWSTT